jgi:hypothetical protein
VKALALLVSLLAAATLAACSSPGSTTAQATNASSAAQRVQALAHGNDEVRSLVELFGSRLQNVSVQSPKAKQLIAVQYAGLVAPRLLQHWMAKPLQAPGRYLSSPWPDHVELVALTYHGSEACSVSAKVVMMSSTEIAGGGAAALVPVHLELRRIAGRWLITGVTPERGFD